MTQKKNALKTAGSRQKTGRSAKKPAPPKAAPKAMVKTGRPASEKASKTTQVLALLKRSGGVTLTELIKATGWQPHSVRGFLSGTIKKKMGLNVASTKPDGGERTYQVSA